ncbi:hypothetical protein C8R43DRAFT_905767 [Mycena crocata]|nr:hypothetical protein C8R43DRAFT_905767 [Mycena crocata]
MEIGQELADHIVCADESAVNILTTYRRNGWATKNLCAYRHCCFVRGTRYAPSYLTLRNRCQRYLKVFCTSCNNYGWYHLQSCQTWRDQFLLWLEGVLQVMNPYPAKHSILVLDNCRIHHVEGVEEMCAEA